MAKKEKERPIKITDELVPKTVGGAYELVKSKEPVEKKTFIKQHIRR